MKNPKIEIKSDGAFTEIFVNGNKLDGVRSYTLSQEAGELPILTVDLNAFNLSVDAKALLMQKGVGNIIIGDRE